MRARIRDAASISAKAVLLAGDHGEGAELTEKILDYKMAHLVRVVASTSHDLTRPTQ